MKKNLSSVGLEGRGGGGEGVGSRLRELFTETSLLRTETTCLYKSCFMRIGSEIASIGHRSFVRQILCSLSFSLSQFGIFIYDQASFKFRRRCFLLIFKYIDSFRLFLRSIFSYCRSKDKNGLCEASQRKLR